MDVFSSLLLYLNRNKTHIPVISVLSEVSERLCTLRGFASPENMNCESNRRQSFKQWPHINFKWANPDKMAQAGFFHEPANTGEDRVVCFSCKCCLVHWEPSDEAWSEHGRHSSTCPYILGEYTPRDFTFK